MEKVAKGVKEKSKTKESQRSCKKEKEVIAPIGESIKFDSFLFLVLTTY